MNIALVVVRLLFLWSPVSAFLALSDDVAELLPSVNRFMDLIVVFPIQNLKSDRFPPDSGLSMRV